MTLNGKKERKTMISHNESLQDKLSHISRALGDKAHQHHDNELRQLKEDFDWLVAQEILSLAENGREDEYGISDYDRGHEDGYEEAKEAVINAL